MFGPRKLAGGSYPMVIPIFLDQKKKGQKLTIVGDGKNTRDYIHVKDVVKANIAAWKSSVVDGQAINIGGGVQTSVNKIAELIGGELMYLPPREGEMRFIEANNTKARELLGWEPTVTLEEGVAELKKEWGIE